VYEFESAHRFKFYVNSNDYSQCSLRPQAEARQTFLQQGEDAEVVERHLAESKAWDRHFMQHWTSNLAENILVIFIKNEIQLILFLNFQVFGREVLRGAIMIF